MALSKKSRAILGATFALGLGVAYYIWQSTRDPMLVEAHHYASEYEGETDESGRCASADLAAAYYKWGNDQVRFEEWKAKAEMHCAGGFPHAYYLPRPSAQA